MTDFKKKYSLKTAIYIVIANMIGTGVFTSLYFQVDDVPSESAILLLWILGGVVALFGGFAYAEIAGMFPRSGGEYEYISKLYHPSLGFATGICTFIVGFCAPMASSAINAGNYLSPIFGYIEDGAISKSISTGIMLLIALVQLGGVHTSSKFQNISTIFKIVLIAIFILLPFMMGNYEANGVDITLDTHDKNTIASGVFFTSLALMYFAYTGWNSSIYITEELEQPQRNIPLSILIGVATVTIIYLMLNFAFMYVCSFEEIKLGGSSVGNTVTKKLFGESSFSGIKWVNIFSGLFSIALLSTINGNMVTAPRVVETMSKDFKVLSSINKRNKNNTPHVATYIICFTSIIFIWISDLKSLLEYVGFTLAIFASMAVFGVYMMRWKEPNRERPFRAWGYPFTPFLFIFINFAMIYYSVETMYGGNYLYNINESGRLIISPLSASAITIAITVLIYFGIKTKNEKLE